MTDDEAQAEPEMWVADVVEDGPEKGAVISREKVKARDLTQDYVGKFIGCRDKELDVNYGAKIRKIQHFEDGDVPGVSVWFTHSALPDGRPARDDRSHVPFDFEFEIVEMMTW
ncbi:hypothetical protein AB4Z39_25520 [Mycobacterium adipatum]|uniref:hypothetical protein n=1 Tax=Mycobacterium adipatum TaxID=1682113 RepID=UPI0034E07668